MLEFRLVVQNGDARPYSLWTFPNFEACYVKLIEIIQNKSTCVRPEYYVINEFYKNTYQPFLKDITKYTIECREVTEWVLYKKENEKNNKKSNIVYLFG